MPNTRSQAKGNLPKSSYVAWRLREPELRARRRGEREQLRILAAVPLFLR